MNQKETRLAINETGTPNTTCASTPSDQSRVCKQCRRLTAAVNMAPRRSICQDCRKTNQHTWYETNKTRVLAHQRDYRANNPGTGWAKSHRKRKRAYGLDHVTTDLVTQEDIVARWGDRCIYCDDAPFQEPDHVVPVRAGGPHTIWNLVPSCKPCNAKKRWTVDRAWIAFWFDDDPARDAESRPSGAGCQT